LTTNIQSSRTFASTMSICARYEFHCPDLRPCSFTSYPKMPSTFTTKLSKISQGRRFRQPCPHRGRQNLVAASKLVNGRQDKSESFFRLPWRPQVSPIYRQTNRLALPNGNNHCTLRPKFGNGVREISSRPAHRLCSARVFDPAETADRRFATLGLPRNVSRC
jgi:hypothetical protein